jgi:hypothetical protein
MATIFLRKLYDKLVPVDESSMEAFEKLKMNGEYNCELAQPRNYLFHKKAFALVNYAFSVWEPGEQEYKGQPVQKSFDVFRDEITIMAGYYEQVFKVDGSFKLVAKSWSFANMSQDDFNAMYSNIIDVILAKVLSGYTRSDLDDQVNKILGYC